MRSERRGGLLSVSQMSRLALQRYSNRVAGEVGAECPVRDTVWNIYIEPAFYLLAL